ncbi:MAG: hypothetical protein SGBAC_013063 [Bacillariaceae sp.]
MKGANQNRNAHPYDEEINTNLATTPRKGLHEPPARYRSYDGELTDRIDEIESRGIVPLDPLADDDSVVLPNEDRYNVVGSRDPTSVQQSRKKEMLKKVEGSRESGARKKKKKEPEAFHRAKSFQTMDMAGSVAMTEVGGCVNLFDAIFFCVEDEELRKAQSGDSEYSDDSDDY